MAKRRREQSARAEPEAERMYEVEQILDKRLSPNGLMYLIRWKDYPDPSDYTWEPIQHLTEVEDLVRAFNESCDQRITRQKAKVEPTKPNRPRKQQVQESEEEEEEEKPQLKKLTRKRKMPSEEKSQVDRKQTSGNEDEDDEDEEVVNHSKPRKVEPRKAEAKKEKVWEKEKEKEAKKGRDMEAKTEVDRYWEEQGLELGRIHKHHLEEGKLVFSVNLNKGELVFGMIPLRIDEMRAIDEEKLVAYMENWARHHLIEKDYQTTQEYKDFENFWRSVD